MKKCILFLSFIFSVWQLSAQDSVATQITSKIALAGPNNKISPATLAQTFRMLNFRNIAVEGVLTERLRDTAAELRRYASVIGEVKMFAGSSSSLQEGWLTCEGQELLIHKYQQLYAVISNTYGGDGITTFKLPDLRGRVPLGIGQGSGLSTRTLGEEGGVESVSLTVGQMPSHSHTATIHAGGDIDTCDTNVALGNMFPSDRKGGGVPPMIYTNSATPAVLHAFRAETASIAQTGNGESHENMQPFLSLNFIIRVK